MSEIQRWSVARSELCPVGEESVEVVTYADHLAALVDAVATERKEKIAECFHHQDLAEEAERYRIRKAVGEVFLRTQVTFSQQSKILDAIDNEEE